jgi:D-alanyl-D-alanine endopeptidase (penicillin-binding protein 7)
MFAQSLILFIGLLSIQAGQSQTTPGLALEHLPVMDAPVVAVPTKKNPESFGVEISARAGVVMDVASGEMLFEKDANTAYPIASLTKLMTVMTFLDDQPNLDEEIVVASDDQASEGKLVFASGERLTKDEVLHSVLVGSVNAGANVLARANGSRDAFVRKMNEKARALGMRHAFFVEPTGLDPRNRASAKDVALALRATLSYPEIRESTELTHYNVRGRATGKLYEIESTNLLLDSFLNQNHYRIVAGKTGSLPEAGFCLAQDTKNAKGNEMIAVVLGSDNHFSRFQDAKALTAWAFDNFEWK